MKLNPHGSGFACGTVISRTRTPNAPFIRAFLRARKDQIDQPALFHSRNATGDSPRSHGNVHPFPVRLRKPRSAGLLFWEDGIMAHNGYLFPHEGEDSDSRIFAEKILPRYDLNDEHHVKILEERMGRNKAVILRPGGALILNEGLGYTLEDGTWHSNGDFTGVSHHVPGCCPACGTETEMTPACLACEMEARERFPLLMDPVGLT